ncbi:tetratricopeptide repeat protein [Aquisphaera giovannonii]|uniref:Tetratricopeptide repeat protein n=1 Tax=Aquisphaera giovannonii TaxID=406548 RepID=A0A5B9VXP2_9BACT|nr:CRTAC1 family protein [Aquisphaera giovannonii]QEH33146.1 tetratricopeptide repeat protein [Aquisphaera giovannonii]
MSRLARRREWSFLLGALVVVGLGYGGWRIARAYRREAALAGIRRHIEQGRHGLAAQALAQVLASEPDLDEASYLLGLCEKNRNRPEAADAAWARVAPGSRFASAAVTGRASILIDGGRLADAEELLTRALGDPKIDGFEPRRLLTPLLWQEGRVAEAQRLVEANWESMKGTGREGSQEAIELARLHIAMRVGTASADSVRNFLDRAGRLAPDDPRIQLGRANLAIRQGALADAARLLEECLRRSPEDVPAWRSRLELARAAGKLEDVLAALAHLPAADADDAELHRQAAWIAARSGDGEVETRQLESLAEADPGDVSTLDRLAELAIREGRPARAEELRRRKAELDRLNEQYKELLLRDQPVRDAARMAELAGRLGHRFEARVFASVALASDPDREDMRALLARPGGRGRDGQVAGPTLADALRSELGESAAGAGMPRALPAAPDAAAVLPRFDDDAPRAGLAHVFRNGESAAHALPEVSSGGVGLIDFDGDGWLDVYAVQGGTFPPANPAVRDWKGVAGEALPSRGDRLFRNRRDGTFEDVTESAGLPAGSRGYGHGVAVGDYDNDGHADLFVTRWRSYALYRNLGNGTFEDATVAAGLGGDRDWPTSAAFADLDNDGDLDLYVCHYLRWDADHPRLCQNDARTAYTSCDPLEFDALPDHVFRNDGGRFADVTVEAGIVDRDGRGFGVVAADVDDDGRVDLFVANDRSANYLFRNLGGFRFEEQGLVAGVACNAHGSNQAGMGVAAGDLDGDGKLDLAVTNFHDESTTLFLNLGGGLFVDHTAAIGLAAPSRTRLGFGIAFLDANNDGTLDLLTANGHVNDYRPKVPYAMRAQLLVGGPGGWLTDVTDRVGPPFLIPHLGRGLASGDVDNDGRVDALLVAANEPLVYLHNRTAGGHFLTVALEGTKSARDAVGARVAIEAAGLRRVSQRLGGGSFLSAGDPRLHFGLGPATRVDRIEVRWPSGKVDNFRDVEADRAYRFREGEGQPAPGR